MLRSDYLQYSRDLNIAPALQPMNNVTAIWLKATQSSYEPTIPAAWTFLIQRRDWHDWYTDWRWYIQVIEIGEKSNAEKISALLYNMGQQQSK